MVNDETQFYSKPFSIFDARYITALNKERSPFLDPLSVALMTTYLIDYDHPKETVWEFN